MSETLYVKGRAPTSTPSSTPHTHTHTHCHSPGEALIPCEDKAHSACRIFLKSTEGRKKGLPTVRSKSLYSSLVPYPLNSQVFDTLMTSIINMINKGTIWFIITFEGEGPLTQGWRHNQVLVQMSRNVQAPELREEEDPAGRDTHAGFGIVCPCVLCVIPVDTREMARESIWWSDLPNAERSEY